MGQMRRIAWAVWIVLSILSLSAPLNPVLNRPEALLPFYVVTAVIGLASIAIATRSSVEEAEVEKR
jgi:hypothetical protein